MPRCLYTFELCFKFQVSSCYRSWDIWLKTDTKQTMAESLDLGSWDLQTFFGTENWRSNFRRIHYLLLWDKKSIKGSKTNGLLLSNEYQAYCLCIDSKITTHRDYLLPSPSAISTKATGELLKFGSGTNE